MMELNLTRLDYLQVCMIFLIASLVTDGALYTVFFLAVMYKLSYPGRCYVPQDNEAAVKRWKTEFSKGEHYLVANVSKTISAEFCFVFLQEKQNFSCCLQEKNKFDIVFVWNIEVYNN